MTTENLFITCDEILSLEPIKNGQGSPIIKMLVDDVNLDLLMPQIAEKCDAHYILDHLTDDDISEYMEKRESKYKEDIKNNPEDFIPF